MAISRIICDRCGEAITRARAVVHVESGPLRLTHRVTDLCLDCQHAFVRWMREVLEPALEGPPGAATRASPAEDVGGRSR